MQYPASSPIHPFPFLHPVLMRSALATLALASSAAGAATPEQLARVKLYADVTIAEDRVDQWGPWEEFEPPAAGPVPFNLALADTRELYRPLPTLQTGSSPAEPAGTACAAGSLCGYGLQALFVNGQQQGPATLQVVTLEPGGTAGGLYPVLSDSLSARLEALADGSSVTTPALDAADGSTQLYATPDVQTVAWVAVPSNDSVPTAPNLVLTTYVQGSTGSLGQLVGHVGRVTSTADMATLRTGAATASYVGQDLHLPSGQRGTVNISVDFGQGTFSYATAGGVQSYQAQGVVRGSGYVATGFTTPNTSGTLQGHFVGSAAAGTVGGASVTQNGVQASTIHATTRQVPQ